MIEDKIFTNQRLINLGLIITAIWFTWFAQNTFDEYTVRIINNVAIFIILAVSYNLINGVTGQFSLEPNGFVAIGAYVTAILLVDSEGMIYQYDIEDPYPWVLALQTNFLWALILSGTISALLALSLSFPVFRVRGDYLAIVTLGFGFIIRILAINSPEITNGSLGINDIPEYSNLYWTGGVAIFTVMAILNIIYSKYGRAMKAVRDDEDAATAMGVNTFKIKTMAFSTSAFFEGVGGGLLAALLTSISPDLFTFFLTFQLLIIIVLGGLGSTTGAILGTIFVMAGLEYMRFLDEPMNLLGFETDAMPGMRMVVFSLILILVMLFAREGLMGKRELKDLFKKKKGRQMILEVCNVTKKFGGVTAIKDTSFSVQSKEIYGLIGPNGAGKTTMFNIITGNYEPTEGDIKFHGQKINGIKPFKIVHRGIARTFQNIRLFKSMTVMDNVLIGFDYQATYTYFEAIFRLPRFFKEERRVRKRAIEIMEVLDIAQYSDELATSLSYGQQRKVEIARALAANPQLLLLDEPAAGMNPQETHELAELFFKIRDEFDITILLIEHDMKFVNKLCDRVMVLDYGKTIFEGDIKDAIQNEEVIKAYLGDFKHA